MVVCSTTKILHNISQVSQRFLWNTISWKIGSCVIRGLLNEPPDLTFYCFLNTCHLKLPKLLLSYETPTN